MPLQAQALLEKLGWKQGMGLGKNLDGRTQHVRVVQKSDTAGIGVNKTQWDSMWWDNIYNKAAKNIQLAESGDSSDSSDDDDAKTKREAKKAKKAEKALKRKREEKAKRSLDDKPAKDSVLRSHFSAKTKIITTGSADSDSDEATHVIDDAALFEKCERRVLRKYVPEGKLKRIQMQDASARSPPIAATKPTNGSAKIPPPAALDTATRGSSTYNRLADPDLESSDDDDDDDAAKARKKAVSKKSSEGKKKKRQRISDSDDSSDDERTKRRKKK